MRLKPDKIKVLSKIIYDGIRTEKELKVNADREAVEAVIASVIEDDLRDEDEIEADAEKLLEAHMDEIRRSDAQFHTLLQKTKERLARERRFTL